MPNTAKVIYAWDKKSLIFSKNSNFCKQEIYKNDRIIDILVNIELYLLFGGTKYLMYYIVILLISTGNNSKNITIPSVFIGYENGISLKEYDLRNDVRNSSRFVSIFNDFRQSLLQ